MAQQSDDQVAAWNDQSGERWVAYQAPLDAMLAVFGQAAIAAVLAFMPLTQSVFWGSMAYALIGGTAVGTIPILLFLPALYAIWFRIRPEGAVQNARVAGEMRAAAQ